MRKRATIATRVLIMALFCLFSVSMGYAAPPAAQRAAPQVQAAPSAAQSVLNPNAPPKGSITITPSSKRNVNASTCFTGSYQYIEWTCTGTRTHMVDVTLWKDNQKKITIGTGIATGQTAYAVPWDLAPGQYELRITSEDDSRVEARLAVAIVSTTLTLTTPKKDDIWYGGGTYQIAWQIQGTQTSVNVSLWQIGPNKTTDIGTGISGGNMQYTAPLSLPPDQYYLYVNGKDAPGVTGAQHLFVMSPTVGVTSPKAGDSWTTGSTYPISWQFTGNPGPLKIEIYKSPTDSVLIVDNISAGSGGSGTYNWKLPSLLAEGNYRIRVTSQTVASATDSSGWMWVVKPPPPPKPYVKWDRPYCGNVGCNAEFGKPFPIKWSFSNCGDQIDITIYELTDSVAGTLGAKQFDVKNWPVTGQPVPWIPALPADKDCGNNIRCRQYYLTLKTSGGCSDGGQIDEFK